MSGDHISVRVGEAKKKLYREAARRLGLSSLTDLVVMTLDAISGATSLGGWECRRIYIVGTTIAAIGEEAPHDLDDELLLCASYRIVAPTAFWAVLEAATREDDLHDDVSG